MWFTQYIPWIDFYWNWRVPDRNPYSIHFTTDIRGRESVLAMRYTSGAMTVRALTPWVTSSSRHLILKKRYKQHLVVYKGELPILVSPQYWEMGANATLCFLVWIQCYGKLCNPNVHFRDTGVTYCVLMKLITAQLCTTSVKKFTKDKEILTGAP